MMEKTKWKTSIVASALATAALIWLISSVAPGGLGLGEPVDAAVQDHAETYDSGGSAPPVGAIIPQANVGMDGLFVKFDDVDGEATDANFRAWSHAITFEQGQIQPNAGGGTTRARGDALAEPFVIVKELDKAGPKLAEAVFKAKVFPNVQIHLSAAQASRGGVTYYSYELKNVVITGYHIGANEYGGVRPVETISMAFEQIKASYVEYDIFGNPRGTVQYSWNLTGG
jgi:type VI secretion system Hcp family effector